MPTHIFKNNFFANAHCTHLPLPAHTQAHPKAKSKECNRQRFINTTDSMDLKQEIENNSGGAKFVRADLHIHTFGENGSYDVKDTQMTLQNIVDLAIQ
ncbi:MAG: hypothetical protein IPF93_08515 [Saprospiraceae bacterium]|nr:hypothetical protein [Saprospiraceae bacterium]